MKRARFLKYVSDVTPEDSDEDMEQDHHTGTSVCVEFSPSRSDNNYDKEVGLWIYTP